MYKGFCRKKHSCYQRDSSLATGKDKRVIREEVKRYISLLQDQNIPVIKAYLFGSHAKNMADEWSDIDVAAVTDRFIGDRFDFRFLLTKLARKIDSDIEPHPYLSSEFNSGNPMAAKILMVGDRIL